MRRLIVYLNNKRSGTLEQDDSGLLRFTYDRTWLDDPDAIPLSRSLPLQSTQFHGKKARPFFAGILPEEEPRLKIAAILGISAKNDFAMLEGIGGECAGAVSLLPDGINPPENNENSTQILTDNELHRIIQQLPQKPLMAGTEGLRLSLAGAQYKIPVIFRGHTFSFPVDNTPTTHIIKPEPDRFPGLATNEVFCMSLAKKIGLKVPDIEFLLSGNIPCVLVCRYDRHTDNKGLTLRIHQEDFCQALGYPPEKKYQAEGGPLLRECIAMLRDWSTTPALDIRDFIDSLIFNVIIGNADAHGKNFSILYSNNTRRLAPFYDLVCTLAWDELSKTPSMKIGKSKQINTITLVDFKEMAEETGLGWPMIRDRIGQMADEILNHSDTIGNDLPKADTATLERVKNIVTNRANKMKDK